MPASAAWAERLRIAVGEYGSPDEKSSARIGNYASRWTDRKFSTFSRWTAVVMGAPALSMETSYQSRGDRTLTIADYREIGCRIADAVTVGISEAGAGETMAGTNVP